MSKEKSLNGETNGAFDSLSDMEKALNSVQRELEKKSAGELIDIFQRGKGEKLLAVRAWEEFCSRAGKKNMIKRHDLQKLSGAELLEIISRLHEHREIVDTALEILFYRYRELCFKIDENILGAGDAETLVNEKFLKILRKPLEFRCVPNTRSVGDKIGQSFILKTDKNMARKFLKKKKQDRRKYERMLEEREKQMEIDSEPAIHEEEKIKKLECLLREYEKLKPVQKAALLGIAHKVPYEILAKSLGISKGSLGQHIYRARERLRERCG